MRRRRGVWAGSTRIWGRLVAWAIILAIGVGMPPVAATATDQDSRWSVASLPEPRDGMQTFTAGDVALFFGGSSLGPPSNVVDIYDHAARQWTTATLSVGRTGPSTATVGSKILVAGGWDGTGAASRVVDLYDTATGQWSITNLGQPWSGGKLLTVGQTVLLPGPETVDVLDAQSGQVTTAPLAEPRTGSLVVVVGSRALLAGGMAGDVPSTTIDVYDSATGRWTIATLPRARTGMQAAVVGERVLFAGGEVDKQPTDVVDVYDVATGAWTMEHLSVARRDFALAVVGNVALFADGTTPHTSSEKELDVVDLYDGATGTWSTAALAEKRRVAAAVAGTHAVFATADACYEKDCVRTVDVYDGQTGAWSTTELHAPELFAPGFEDDGIRVGGAILGVGNRVLFAGGSRIARFGGGNQYSARFSTTSMQIYDAESGQWSEATLSNAAYGPSTSISGTLVALAGHNSGRRELGMYNPPQPDTVFSTVDLYDSATGEWIPGPLSQARRDLGMAVLGNTAIFAGGTIRNAEDSATNQVEIYDGATGQLSRTTFPREGVRVGSLMSRTVGTRVLFYERFGMGPVDIFDVATRQWTTNTISPSRSDASVAVVGDRVLFAGGHDSDTSDSSATVDLFDGRTGQWSVLSLSQARDTPGVAVVGTHAIFAGGTVKRKGQGDLDSDVVDIYDATTGAWTTTALPSVRGNPTVSPTVGTQALFLRKDQGDVYDAATGAWTTMASVPDTIERYGVKVLTVGTAVLVVDQPKVAVYESTTGQWTTTALPQGREDAAVAVVGPEVIFAGGRRGVPATYLASADIYDGRTGTWRTATLPEPHDRPAVAVRGSRAIFAGGSVYPAGSTHSDPSDQVDVYDGATGAWTTARLSTPRQSPAAAVVRSTVLFVGGSGGGQGRNVPSDRVDFPDLSPEAGG